MDKNKLRLYQVGFECFTDQMQDALVDALRAFADISDALASLKTEFEFLKGDEVIESESK